MANNPQNGHLQTDEKAGFPLRAFFSALKDRGFTVTPQQIAETYRLVAEYAAAVKNIRLVRDYLCPIFATGRDEQQKFNDLFDIFFSEPIVTVARPQSFLPRIRYTVIAAIFLTLAIIVWVVLQFHGGSTPTQITFTIADADSSAKALAGKQPFQLNAGDTLKVKIKSNLGSSGVTARTNWGERDTLLDATKNQHVYRIEGKDTLKVHISFRPGKNAKETDTTITREVFVCSQSAKLRIARSVAGAIRTGERITLSARVSGDQPGGIFWVINGGVVNRTQRLDTTFATEGRYRIEAIAAFGDTGSVCSLKQYIDVNVYNPGKVQIALNRAANAKAIPTVHVVTNKFYYLFFVLPLLSLLFFIYIVNLLQRRKKRLRRRASEEQQSASREYEKLLSGFSGTGEPIELPFKDKNYLVESEEQLNDVARLMRRRSYDGSSYIDIGLTIKRAIKNFGLIEPVLINRKTQTEFLFLIEGRPASSQQSRFFDCFAELLEKQNVFINRFFFGDEFKLFRNKEFPAGLSLEKMFDRFPSSVVVIFGNGYMLLHSPYPSIREELMEQLNSWRGKALVTHVPPADWGNRELNVLPEAIPVFPVELEAQLELMQKLVTNEADGNFRFENEDIKSQGISELNFDNAEHLKRYFDRFEWANVQGQNGTINVLFQWVAACAVYPQLRWELILTIGKAIFEAFGKGEQFNISVLLIICRVRWMNKNTIPVQLRLNLLNNLDNRFEIIAREAILTALKEIPENEITEAHFAFEEKRLQQITNEFILYSHNPIKYPDYKASKQLFELLYNDGKVTDATGLIYLQNEEGSYGTLIRRPHSETKSDKQEVPLDKYFSAKYLAYNWVRWVSAIPLILSTITLIMMVFWPDSDWNPFSLSKKVPYSTYPVHFSMADSTDDHSLQNATLNFKNKHIDFDKKHRTDSITLPAIDSGHLSIIGAGSTLLDTEARLKYTAYTIVARSMKLFIKYNFIYAQGGIGKNTLKVFVYNPLGNPVSNASVNVLMPPALQLLKGSPVTGLSNSLGEFTISFSYRLPADRLRNQVIQISVRFNQSVGHFKINTLAQRPIPGLFIFYTDSSKYPQMKKLQQCLAASGQFIVSEPILRQVGSDGDTLRNELRYFRKSFADTIQTVLACLKSNLPDLKFTPEKETFPAQPGDAAEIWVSFSDPPRQAPIGIDISHNNQAINDWSKIKRAGISFVFFKATQGATSKDPLFSAYWDSSKSYLMRGAYHYFDLTSPAKTQAENFINSVQLQKGDLPPALVIEWPVGATDKGTANLDSLFAATSKIQIKNIKIILDAFEAHYKVKPIIYTAKNFWRQYLANDSTFSAYPLWVPAYQTQQPSLFGGWTKYTFWQFTDHKQVEGIGSDLDVNRFNGTIEQLKALTIK